MFSGVATLDNGTRDVEKCRVLPNVCYATLRRGVLTTTHKQN